MRRESECLLPSKTGEYVDTGCGGILKTYPLIIPCSSLKKDLYLAKRVESESCDSSSKYVHRADHVRL